MIESQISNASSQVWKGTPRRAKKKSEPERTISASPIIPEITIAKVPEIKSSPSVPTKPIADDELSGISLSFGDEEVVKPKATPAKPSVELVSQWKRVLQDLSQINPLLTALLQDTRLERLQNPGSATMYRVIFPGSLRFAFQQFQQNPTFSQSLKEYLEEILMTTVTLELHCADLQAGEQAPADLAYMNAPNRKYEEDRAKESIFQSIENIFKANWIRTRSVQRKEETTEEEPPVETSELEP